MTERFSASVASRLEVCPGSGNLDLAIPGWEQEPRDQMAGAAGRGTWMHDILAWACSVEDETDRSEFVAILRAFALLTYRTRDELVVDPDKAWAWLDKRSPWAGAEDKALIAGLNHNLHSYTNADGVVVVLGRLTPKELKFLADAIEYFNSVVFITGTANLHQEEKVTIDWLTSRPRTTADVVVWDEETLHIIDWKTGAIAVDAVDNTQLEFYAAAWIHRVPPSVQKISVHIVQPGNTSQWLFSRRALMNRMAELEQAEARVLAKDLTLVPSDHCKFCPANPHSRGDKGTPSCPAMLKLLYPPMPADEDAILDLV